MADPRPPVVLPNYLCGECGQLMTIRQSPALVRVIDVTCGACAQPWSIFLADAVAAETVCAGRRGEGTSV